MHKLRSHGGTVGADRKQVKTAIRGAVGSTERCISSGRQLPGRFWPALAIPCNVSICELDDDLMQSFAQHGEIFVVSIFVIVPVCTWQVSFEPFVRMTRTNAPACPSPLFTSACQQPSLEPEGLVVAQPGERPAAPAKSEMSSRPKSTRGGDGKRSGEPAPPRSRSNSPPGGDDRRLWAAVVGRRLRALRRGAASLLRMAAVRKLVSRITAKALRR